MAHRITPLRPATEDPEDIAQRKRLIQRTIRIRDEIQIHLNTVAYWNEHVRKPHEDPIDPDPDGELRARLKALNEVLVADGVTRVM